MHNCFGRLLDKEMSSFDFHWRNLKEEIKTLQQKALLNCFMLLNACSLNHPAKASGSEKLHSTQQTQIKQTLNNHNSNTQLYFQMMFLNFAWNVGLGHFRSSHSTFVTFFNVFIFTQDNFWPRFQVKHHP